VKTTTTITTNSDSYYYYDRPDTHTPFVEVIPNGAMVVAAGIDHSLVLKQDGSVWATGHNTYGQLGDGTTTNYKSPVKKEFAKVVPSGATAVTAGWQHSMVLKQDGSVWATGSNRYGQFGDGTTTHSKTFVKVIPGGVMAVAADCYHSMVLKSDGSLWAAGNNDYGQLGDGTRTGRKNLIKVIPSGVTAISAGRTAQHGGEARRQFVGRGPQLRWSARRWA